MNQPIDWKIYRCIIMQSFIPTFMKFKSLITQASESDFLPFFFTILASAEMCSGRLLLPISNFDKETAMTVLMSFLKGLDFDLQNKIKNLLSLTEIELFKDIECFYTPNPYGNLILDDNKISNVCKQCPNDVIKIFFVFYRLFSSYFLPILQIITTHNSYFSAQGNTDLSLHFWQIDNTTLCIDYHRCANRFFEQKKFASRIHMLAFYDYSYFLKDNPPSDERIYFWFAMDQYLENLWDKDGNLLSKLVLDAKDDEERNSYGLDRFRNYVHRIMSVSDDLLNDKEKAFRDWTRVPENQEKFLQAYKKSFFGLEKNNDHVNILDENKLLFCKKVFEKEINEKTEKKVLYYLKYQDPKTKLWCEYPADIEKKYKELKLIECQEEMNFPNPEYMSYLFHTEPEQLSEVEKEFVCVFLYSPSEYIFYKNMDTDVVCKKIDEFLGWAQKSNYSKDDRENIKQVADFLGNFFDVKIMLHKKLNTLDIRTAINKFRNSMANYKSEDINYVYRFIGNLAKNFFDMDDEPLFRAFEKKIIKEKIYHTKIKRENWNLDGLDKEMLKFLDDKNRIDEFTQKFEEKYHDEKLLNGLINKTLGGEKDMLQDPVGSRRENESELDYMERQFKAYVDLSSKKWMKNETKKQLFKEAVSMSSQVQNNFSQENTMIKTNTRELKQSHVVTGNKTQSSQANKTSSSNIANWLKILLVIILSAALTLILLRFVFQASLLFLILGPSLTSVFCGALGVMYFYKTTQRGQAKYLASIKENNLGHKNFAEDQANSQNRSNTNNLKINLEAYKKDIDKKVI